jgi:hypothetical protein
MDYLCTWWPDGPAELHPPPRLVSEAMTVLTTVNLLWNNRMKFGPYELEKMETFS